MESKVINKQQHFRSSYISDCSQSSVLLYFYLNVEPAGELQEYWLPAQNGKLDAAREILHGDQIYKKNGIIQVEMALLTHALKQTHLDNNPLFVTDQCAVPDSSTNHRPSSIPL